MSDLALQDPFWQAPQCPSKLSLAFLVSRIYTAEINMTVKSLVELQQHLNAPVLTNTLLRELDGLLEAITYRLERATPCFLTSEKGEGMTPEAIAKAQLFDHLLALCLIIFGKEETARAISEEPWRRLLECVTHLVIEEDIRPYNILINRMLRLSDRNLTFRVLLTLLERSALELSPYDAPDSPAVRFVGLVMRYIWRRTKSIADDIRDGLIQVDQLLQECHLFIAASPPAVWVRRTDEQYPLTNQPLRTVKTILHELAGELGRKVLDVCRRAIPAADNKGYIYLYLERVLEEGHARAAAAAITSDAPASKVTAHATMAAAAVEERKGGGRGEDGVSLTVESNAEGGGGNSGGGSGGGGAPAVGSAANANESSMPVIATTAALAVASGMTAAADIISIANADGGAELTSRASSHDDRHKENEQMDGRPAAASGDAMRQDSAYQLHVQFELALADKSNRPLLHARPPSARRSTLTSKHDIGNQPVDAATPCTDTIAAIAEAAPPTPFMATTPITATATATTTQAAKPHSPFHADPDLGIKLTSTFAKLFITGERDEGIEGLSKLRREHPLTDDFIRNQLARSTPAFKEEITRLLQEASLADHGHTVEATSTTTGRGSQHH
ncbi:hypothetical protein SYNPS1DRAFT_30368 [Syncephalis pseudoplumigaleata]|uniref:Uncharacterized protein n=1 Tax=Syncephalis pseudoplumigaleata TaxID=1712513 RepID=A0A4P9YX28_9FUNG|nr:hypothetical protein SYNPS1DRAFT_30368 [Syncephalis pseudoplumigaleata]|eukprot:RKP23871.1 hypothetical protein SYNPS1DRAFT_30368 [Syncephalis pseudoplumigaleata]